jgi:DNA replication and repair protein RecF
LALTYFSCRDFRCLTAVELTPAPRYNLVHGPNASGKTSLLEAIAYLGRGKSFRGATTEGLVRHGTSGFVIFGRVRTAQRERSVGVRNGRMGLEISVDGSPEGGAAALADVLALQVVDPEVHQLVAGGPEFRRRFLDWIGFHVEHGYLDRWRRFRRVLQQRNAALKAGTSSGLKAWDREFVEAGCALDEGRRAVLARSVAALEACGRRLLKEAVGFEYQQGWHSGESLGEALLGSVDRDLRLGSSQAGPHRADLRLVYDERRAQKLVSRGQQKLLACTMILAATEVVQAALERRILLLLDDPAAELDAASLERLMGEVAGLGSQVVATALHREARLFPEASATFHVEQGQIHAE